MVPFVAVTHNDHMGTVLSHRKRREGGTCNYLVKVKMKQLSVQGALNNTSAILTVTALCDHRFVQLEKTNIIPLSNRYKKLKITKIVSVLAMEMRLISQ